MKPVADCVSAAVLNASLSKLFELQLIQDSRANNEISKAGVFIDF